MLKELRPAIVLIIAFTIITGLALPSGHDRHRRRDLSPSGARQPDREGREGDWLRADGTGIHVRPLLPWPAVSHARPDPADPYEDRAVPYNAANSGGLESRTDQQGTHRARQGRCRELKAENPSAQVPIDLVTTSGSGLDPHISPDGAYFQVPRIAKARNMPENAFASSSRSISRVAPSGSSASRALTCLRSTWLWIAPERSDAVAGQEPAQGTRLNGRSAAQPRAASLAGSPA